MFVENALNAQRALHMRSNSEYIWPNVQHNLPNACAFHQMRSHLAIVGKFDQMRSALDQMRNVWSKARAFGQMCSAIGQM